MLDGSVRWRLVDVEAEEAAAADASTPRGGIARTFSSRGLTDDLSRCLVAFEYATPPLPRDDAAAPEGWDDRLASWRRLAQRALLEAALHRGVRRAQLERGGRPGRGSGQRGRRASVSP
ncbi:hypothetical protein EMIHUDRAFT_199221 [Emiliania huxleyi CCMP1516]|uniref:Uncharacterized protein n=2 Tax=Emiliania huxleyi TaxID=2903 RepID=A0A0D3I2H7_EMIH1|nr:hypothetical protein EMIHUDRAFT_199221 [Emiliania huxleyi CCMP1516]EOD05462.1 hypothetical protein EMIHUDRAFT_199221 [Emiliania huxleyi CCMP1516]|eukprot:XP_005757891.1 hypothetical protein EMIHUDRAFT_199221 [Emiliania huxleyi CCMP1516]